MTVAECLVITSDADEFVAALERVDGLPLRPLACTSPEAALDAYRDQAVLFGQPDMLAAVIGKMPAVDWVQSTWAGVTPLLACARRDYVLTGVKGVFGPQMAEYALGYLLAHELRVFEREHAQRRREWLDEPSGALSGKCLGILGTGSIGRHIAAAAASFGMCVIGLSRSGAPTRGFERVWESAGLHDFLAESDHLVSTLPQTRETDGLLDAEALAHLPAGAHFVNVGRSNVVVDAALVSALQGGRLAGATLDVFDEEPLPPDHVFWDVPNLRVTAHVAAVSHPELIVPVFVDNCRRYMDGQPLRHVVDFDAGY